MDVFAFLALNVCLFCIAFPTSAHLYMFCMIIAYAYLKVTTTLVTTNK